MNSRNPLRRSFILALVTAVVIAVSLPLLNFSFRLLFTAINVNSLSSQIDALGEEGRRLSESGQNRSEIDMTIIMKKAERSEIVDSGNRITKYIAERSNTSGDSADRMTLLIIITLFTLLLLLLDAIMIVCTLAAFVFYMQSKYKKK